jgi:hypothetical protein
VRTHVKEPVKEAVEKVGLGLAGTGATWWLETVNLVLGAAVGLLTLVYLVYQIIKIHRELKRRPPEG